MALVVQKYGGTSVGTPERIRAVAHRIAETRRQGHCLVVVVSAMGHTTDELIQLAYQVSAQPSHREMDMLLTTGERISMALLSMALADLGVPALSLTGSQSGIITNQSHRRARIRRILGDRIRGALAEGKIPIVAGFQGVSEDKEVTTLGRGGSDTTAVALAAALNADCCDIFTDVNGVFSADPRIVPDAKLWTKISHDLMVEMAIRGAGVLHPRSVELAKQFSVKLRVRNSLNEDEGTSVVTAEEYQASKGMEDFKVTGVSLDHSRMLLTVHLSRPTVLGALWDRASRSHLSIVSPMFSNGLIHLFIERDSEDEWKRHLEELSFLGFVNSYEFDSRSVPVSIIGDRFAQDGMALYQVMDSLAQSQVSVTLGVASSLAITVAVSVDHGDQAVRALHETFFNK